ncbi:AMP-binding protein [Nocardiopsis trehalosi]|uniref:AMP-binding protein n=1 Tax=Nocardiopsis trehalosi TaxID=109329 RepID=UPI000AF4ABCC|nr:AMP-binding protein [Nocardiopsis trehalosi]
MAVDRPCTGAGVVSGAGAGAHPTGSLTGGLLDRLRRLDERAAVTDSRGRGTDAVAFAATVERAAAGLSRRGMCPDDVVGVLAPVCPERLTAVYTVLAVGGVALPMELTSDLETLIELLTATDVRIILVTAALADIALELADRSRVRQVVAFGAAPDTTPFGELLLPSPDGSDYDPARGLFDNGILGYTAAPSGPRTRLHPHADLARRFRRYAADLRLAPGDTVAVDHRMSEPERAALAAAALWNGASVVTADAGDPCDPCGAPPHDALAALGVTVRGAPTPVRVAARR